MNSLLTKFYTSFNTPLKKLWWLCAVVFAFAILSYAYLVNATVVAIVLRQEGEQQIRAAETSVSELEEHYANLEGRVTISFARSRDFAEPRSTTFAEQKRLVTTLGKE